MDLNKVNQEIKDFEVLIEEKICADYEGELFTGVDLGTAYIVLSVVDKDGRAIAGAKKRATVVKDGVVVDYIGAIKIVKDLKKEIEDIIGRKLVKAATAIPPGVAEGSVKAIVNVVEACDFEVISVVDEPTAAAKVLCVEDGAVVDVGGGTTGISVIESGKVTFTADEPTGGHHMNLVLAGRYALNYEEAETLKHTKEREWDVFPVISPVVEKMASIVNGFLIGKKVSVLYIVGGASTFNEFEKVFMQKTGLNVIKPYNPMLVTPLGIALSCLSEVK